MASEKSMRSVGKISHFQVSLDKVQGAVRSVWGKNGVGDTFWNTKAVYLALDGRKLVK